MARTNNLTNYLTDIANAIRTKTGAQGLLAANTFDTLILNIPSGGLPANWYSVTSFQAMENISNPQTGSICIINEPNSQFVPWKVSTDPNATNSNIFYFPPEVDISDIEDDIYENFGDYVDFALESVGISSYSLGSFFVRVKNDSKAVFSLEDRKTGDKLIIQYTYNNNRHLYIKSNVFIQFNNTTYTSKDIYDCYITRYAYSIRVAGSALGDYSNVYEMLGRFIQTKSHTTFNEKRQSHSFYFPYAFLVGSEPIHIDGAVSISMSSEGLSDEIRITLRDTSGIADRIDIDTPTGSLLYYWIENGYYLIENSCTTSNSYINLSETDMTITSNVSESLTKTILTSALIYEPICPMPLLYVYTNNKWEKYDKGANYQC